MFTSTFKEVFDYFAEADMAFGEIFQAVKKTQFQYQKFGKTRLSLVPSEVKRGAGAD